MKKIFLGGLPKSVTDEKLREMFAHYGEITDYVVMKDPYSKESRGFGFIEFASEEPVDQILKDRPHMIENREIEIRRAMPKDITHSTIHERTKRLFIGGLNYDVTDDVLHKYYSEKFSKYGKVESVEIKRDRDTNASRGFGFITFDSDDAVDAVLIIEPKPVQFGRNCEVKKSEPRKLDDGPDYGRQRPPRQRHSPPGSRNRRRGPDGYYRSSPPRQNYKGMRGRKYDPDPYPARSSSREYYYERSPPHYRGYSGNTSDMYHEEAPYDRGYSYPPYYDYAGPYSSSTQHDSPYNKGSSSSSRQPAPASSYNARPSNPQYNVRTNYQYRQYEPGYRDYESNPY